MERLLVQYPDPSSHGFSPEVVEHYKRKFHQRYMVRICGEDRRDLEESDYPLRHPEFRYKTEFQSHDPEFDYLKSLEIEEKINKIRWCQTANGALFLLSTNDKTIKYWKVQDKKIKKICEVNSDPSRTVGNGSPARGRDL